MRRLVENITSGYVEAANRFMPGKPVNRIVVYVESYDDIAFWRLLLEEFENDSLHFQVMLPTGNPDSGKSAAGELLRGKKSAIFSCLGQISLGKNLIACVDSDYDYLLQDTTGTSRLLNNSPYIVQTYTYSIENYQCYAGCLHHICVQSTLNDKRIMEFVPFMESYSRIVYPLFLWSVWAYKYNMYRDFSLHDFNTVVKLPSFSPGNPSSCLKLLSARIGKNINMLENRFPQALEQIAALDAAIRELGVEPQETYLYIQGHNLYENVISRILYPICVILRRERENEIRQQSVHSEQYDNEIRAYAHSQADFKDLIHKNTHYRVMPQYQRLRERVSGIVQLFAGKDSK